MGLCIRPQRSFRTTYCVAGKVSEELLLVEAYQVRKQAAATGCPSKYGAQPVHGRAHCTGCKATKHSTLIQVHSFESFVMNLQSEVDPLRKGCELLPEFRPKAWLARPS